MAYAAWRPHRAFGMLPFAVALVATTLLSAVFDVTDEVSTPLAEAVHLSELVGLVTAVDDRRLTWLGTLDDPPRATATP